MQIESTFRTDTGRRRKQNQDSGLTDSAAGLFIVADGMGGHQGGETASRMAVEGLSRRIRESNLAPSSSNERRKLLLGAVEKTNREIHSHSQENPDLRGMGTTLTALWLKPSPSADDSAWIAQIGDSRCYLHSPGKFWQLTVDHSHVQALVNARIIRHEDARHHPERNRILRSLGYEAQVVPDLFEFQPAPGQTLLLCSDGLNSLMDDVEIFEILEAHFGKGRSDAPVGEAALDAAARALIDAANGHGGDDNITVLLLRLHD